MIERILCGTDLGPHASYLIYHAVYLARQCGASVEVVHAVEPLNPFAKALFKHHALNPADDTAASQILAAIKESVVERLTDDYMSGLDDLATIANVVIQQGEPAEVILAQARRQDAQLIVLGGGNGEGEGVSLLGATAARVLQLADCPVLTVPLKAETPLDRGENPQMGLW